MTAPLSFAQICAQAAEIEVRISSQYIETRCNNDH